MKATQRETESARRMLSDLGLRGSALEDGIKIATQDDDESVNAHMHYKKDVRHLEKLDVYRVLELFGVTSAPMQHAIKKALCAGQRGAKDWAQDVQEAIDSLQRALEMAREDEVVKKGDINGS